MYANDGPSAVGNTNWQNIIMKTWNGNSWSNPITVSDGVARGSRDGMPVWTQLESGEYILVYEASNKPDHPFIIEYKISPDGLDWSGPANELYTPTGFGKKAGAPFVTKINDGRLVAGFQTDEYSANTGDGYSSMMTMISTDNGRSWDDLHHTFPVSDNENANWNALMATSDNQVIAVTSTANANDLYSAIILRRGLSYTPNNVNLVNNWSFETANVNGWTTYGSDYPERLLIHGINDGLNPPIGGGNYFIGMAGTSGPGTAYIGQTIRGLEDGIYTMKAYMRSSGGQNNCIMEVKDFGGGMLTANCPVTMNWSSITIPNINVTNGQATIGFYASMSNDNQWADIDMIEFIRN